MNGVEFRTSLAWGAEANELLYSLLAYSARIHETFCWSKLKHNLGKASETPVGSSYSVKILPKNIVINAIFGGTKVLFED